MGFSYSTVCDPGDNDQRGAVLFSACYVFEINGIYLDGSMPVECFDRETVAEAEQERKGQ